MVDMSLGYPRQLGMASKNNDIERRRINVTETAETTRSNVADTQRLGGHKR